MRYTNASLLQPHCPLITPNARRCAAQSQPQFKSDLAVKNQAQWVGTNGIVRRHTPQIVSPRRIRQKLSSQLLSYIWLYLTNMQQPTNTIFNRFFNTTRLYSENIPRLFEIVCLIAVNEIKHQIPRQEGIGPPLT